MKITKHLGVIGAALVALMVVGATSASASATICTNDVAHQDSALCEGSHGKHVKVGTQLSAALAPGTHASVTVTSSSGSTIRTVTLKKSTYSGKLTSTTGGGQLESLTFSELESSGCSNVTAKAPRAGKTFPWSGTFTKTSGTDGLLHVTSPSFLFTATCLGISATCEYEASSMTVTIKGGAPAQHVVSAATFHRIFGAEFICGTFAHLTATYNISTPSSLFVT